MLQVLSAWAEWCFLQVSLPLVSEKDNTVEEFLIGSRRTKLIGISFYTATQQKIKSGDTSWKIILNYTFQNQKQTSGSALTYSPEDYIIAHVEQAGAGTASPLYSDSVSMHYMGRLIPSTTYTSGLIFDKSWSNNTFNAITSRPAHSFIGLTYSSEGKAVVFCWWIYNSFDVNASWWPLDSIYSLSVGLWCECFGYGASLLNAYLRLTIGWFLSPWYKVEGFII